MTQELITQAINMFDSYDKWNAFIELSNSRSDIRKRYFEKLKLGLLKHFTDNYREQWQFAAILPEQYRWFIKDYGQESICLLWRTNDLVLWCNPQFFNATEARDLLNTPDFNSIFGCFDNIDTLSTPYLHHFCEERHRYNFDDLTSYSATNEENHDKLSWFAGNKTNEMIKQIADKINKFRTPEITEMFIDLNKRCKKP
jgi:hypothetical protein